MICNTILTLKWYSYGFSLTLLVNNFVKEETKIAHFVKEIYRVIQDILLNIDQMICSLKKYLLDTLFLISQELVLS